jgi:hypothetical protein
MEFLNLRLHFAAHLLCKSLMINTRLVMDFAQISLDLAMSLVMGRSLFSHSLLPVVVTYLEDAYILIVVIDSFCKSIALALLVIWEATDCIQNIIDSELATLYNFFETLFRFLYLGSYCLG